MQVFPKSPWGAAVCLPQLFAVFALCLGPVFAADSEALTGEQVYEQRCASCHGGAGEGTEDFPERLEGNYSLAELEEFIGESMPEGAPEECVGEEARTTAAYIYGAFYSFAAQARNRQQAARIELARLTVPQYRNAIADLMQPFREPAPPTDERGLRGMYFNTWRLRYNEQAGDALINRVDPYIRFDFGFSGPDMLDVETTKFDPHQFSVRWKGSVFAPETGDYEFILETDQAARLWFNKPAHEQSGSGKPSDKDRRRYDIQPPLIDAYVKSGDDDVHRARVFLLAGRDYPLRLEFSKSKQGVNDAKKVKLKPKHAGIELRWRKPGGVVELIPRRNLSPTKATETYVVSTPFPPDDRSLGYERGTAISKAWDESTTSAAIEVAGFVAENLPKLAGFEDPGGEPDALARRFCNQFVERAFRRPLNEELSELFVDRQFEEAPDLETAVKRVVLLALKSPRFLYHEVGDNGSLDYDIASRLSFGLWDSIPDREQLEAASARELSTRQQVVRQAERMLEDPRTRSKLRSFFMQWLKVEEGPDLVKNSERFPGFDRAVAADLRTSLELFIDNVVWSEQSDFRQLFLEDTLYLNGRLAKFYGVDLPPNAPFERVWLSNGQRAGVLSHPYLMANFAYATDTSPIHRGVFITRNLLGRTLRPPEDAFTPLAAEMHPELTTRERVALQTQPQACMNCHSIINPLGFTLENYDAIGRYRDQERGQPIDATGEYETSNGQRVSFAGTGDLAGYLANKSQETHVAFVQRLFRHLVKQPIQAYGPQAMDHLQRSFAENEFSIRKLVVEIMVTSCLKQVADTVAATDG